MRQYYYPTLSVLNGSSGVVNTTICQGETYFAGGSLQTTTGYYIDTFSSANGCDSVVTTNLIVKDLFSSNVEVTICDGESYFVGGANQTIAGIYVDSFLAANGCDSLALTELAVIQLAPTITQLSDTLFTQEEYAQYQWYLNGSPINNANGYFYVLEINGNY